ncbi:MAG TPA: helix-turn-helix transcriptional regulator [Pseudorhizobium sp.]|nr:helix-turn-helix transcriptional regulator [Pseudorhizobium sp.]
MSPSLRRDISPQITSRGRPVQEVLSPLGVADVTHLFLMRTPERLSELVVMHHQRSGIATEHEIKLSALLLPHLRRAITISGLLEAKEIEQARLLDTLDLVDVSVILVAEDGSIIHSNRMAVKAMKEGATLVDDRGTLAATSSSATRELRKAIQAAGQDRTSLRDLGVAVKVGAEGAPSVSAHVLPLQPGDPRNGSISRAVAAVFMGKPPQWHAAADAVSSEFSLTEAEKRLLIILLSGSPLAEAARSLGVSANTAKSHLSNIFSKTGVHRQSELPRLAMHVISLNPCLGRYGDGR